MLKRVNPGYIRLKIALAVFAIVILGAVIVHVMDERGVHPMVSTGAAAIICTLLGFLLSRSLSDSIRRVTEKTELMLEGDFSNEIDIFSNDEIGRLAGVNNALRLKLDQIISEISYEKNKLETIIKQMADGMIAVDLFGHIIHANDAARIMLRVTDEDVNQLAFDDLIMRYSDTLTLSGILDKLEQGAQEETFVYGGATYEVRFDRFHDESGRYNGVIILLQDVTERKKIDDMQVDFVANVSHELKTPLTSIKTYTETLLEGGLENQEMTREFLGIIDSETDRMNRLVKDLLQISRLEHKQLKWYVKEGDLVPLVRGAVKKTEMMARAKEQQVNIMFDQEEAIMLDMDRDRIEQVILNILSNAMKYTEDKGRIDVDVIRHPEHVDIVISDNGIGIPEMELPRVFERFFRVDKARSRLMGGTGLGLSISKQIVEEHRGSIDIESKFGRGTKVTVRLPLAPIRGRRNIL